VEAEQETGSGRSDGRAPRFAGTADAAGNGDTHLEDAERVPVPSGLLQNKTAARPGRGSGPFPIHPAVTGRPPLDRSVRTRLPEV
jgi:hypothetical protein